MAGPQPISITVTPPQRAVLEQLIRQHRAPQALVRRAHIILAAADGVRNTQIARTLGCAYNTVRTWRLRWAGAPALDLGTPPPDALALRTTIAAVLADAARPGAPDTFSAEQIVQIIALACTPPPDADRPTSHWTPRDLADEAKQRGIVTTISPRSVGRFLKAGGSQAPSEPLLAKYQGNRSGGLRNPG
jgi:putative transposase